MKCQWVWVFYCFSSVGWHSLLCRELTLDPFLLTIRNGIGCFYEKATNYWLHLWKGRPLIGCFYEKAGLKRQASNCLLLSKGRPLIGSFYEKAGLFLAVLWKRRTLIGYIYQRQDSYLLFLWKGLFCLLSWKGSVIQGLLYRTSWAILLTDSFK